MNPYTLEFLRDKLARVQFELFCADHKITDTEVGIYGLKWAKVRYALESEESFILGKLEQLR